MRNKNKTLGQMENDWYLKVKYFMSHQNDFIHRIEKLLFRATTEHQSDKKEVKKVFGLPNSNYLSKLESTVNKKFFLLA